MNTIKEIQQDLKIAHAHISTSIELILERGNKIEKIDKQSNEMFEDSIKMKWDVEIRTRGCLCGTILKMYKSITYFINNCYKRLKKSVLDVKSKCYTRLKVTS